MFIFSWGGGGVERRSCSTLPPPLDAFRLNSNNPHTILCQIAYE